MEKIFFAKQKDQRYVFVESNIYPRKMHFSKSYFILFIILYLFIYFALSLFSRSVSPQLLCGVALKAPMLSVAFEFSWIKVL